MGRLVYDQSTASIDLDDRTLAHVQIVVTAKLRRGEAFLFSWSNDVSLGSGRNAIWISPSSSLLFRYSGGRSPHINTRWVEVLFRAANSPSGLYAVNESAADGAAV